MIVPSNRFVRLVTRDGATITGRLLNQDIFTVQLLDSKEQLRSLARADLREFTFIDKSPMPSYRDKLSSQEIDRPGELSRVSCRAEVRNETHAMGSRPACGAGSSVLAAAASLQAQVTFDRLVRAAQEPHNWLSYSGGYFSQRSQRARADYSGQREEPGACMDLSAELARADQHAIRSDAGRGRRHHVHRPAAERHHRARCGERAGRSGPTRTTRRRRRARAAAA